MGTQIQRFTTTIHQTGIGGTSKPVVANRGTAGKAQALDLEQKTPAELDAIIREHVPAKLIAEANKHLRAEIFKDAGITSLREVLALTPEDCLRRCHSDPLQSQMLIAFVQIIQVNIKPCLHTKPEHVRRTPLKTLDVQLCVAGQYREPRQPPRSADPLILQFGDVVRGAEIYMINRSDLDNPEPVKLPTNTLLHAETDGRYSLILDDAWMADNGIKAGAVLEFYQKKEQRCSDSVIVPINPDGAQTIPAPVLSSGEVFGDVVKEKEFLTARDVTPAQVRVERLETRLVGGRAYVFPQTGPDGFAAFVEPGAKIVVENLRTGATSGEVSVQADGTFDANVEAQIRDPILIRVVDHSGRFEDQGTRDAVQERRITCRAGQGMFVLAQNPRLGVPSLPEVSVSSLRFFDDRGTVIGRGAVTPGSIVTVVNQETQEKHVTVADAEGNFQLPSGAKVRDVLDVNIRNPFVPATESRGARCEVSFSVEVGAHRGKLRLDPVPGVNGNPIPPDHGQVALADKIDAIGDGAPRSHGTVPGLGSFAYQVKTDHHGISATRTPGFTLSLAWAARLVGSESWLGGSTFGTEGGGYTGEARATVDPAARRIDIVLDAHQRGGWLDPTQKGSSQLFAPITDGAFDASSAGETFNVFVHTPDGGLLAQTSVLCNEHPAARGGQITNLRPDRPAPELRGSFGEPAEEVTTPEGIKIRVAEPFSDSFRKTFIEPLLECTYRHSEYNDGVHRSVPSKNRYEWSPAVKQLMGEPPRDTLTRAELRQLADRGVSAAKELLEDRNAWKKISGSDFDGRSLELGHLQQAMTSGRHVKINVAGLVQPNERVSIFDYQSNGYAIGVRDARVDANGWLQTHGNDWPAGYILKLKGYEIRVP